MSSILTAVFNATIGWLVNKGRDVAAEKLKEGDVTEQMIHDLIIREVDDIRKKLDELLRKDLLTALDSFETGIKFLYREIDAQRSCDPVSVITAEAAARDAIMATVQSVDGDETSNSNCNFLEAKKRFRMAREKATEASNIKALNTLDLITAIRCRVMAAMLESAMETVATAGYSSSSVKKALEKVLPECEQCLKKLHSLPAVQKSFRVELEKSPRNIKGRFGKDKRREIISTVCQINRAIYDVTPTVSEDLRCVHFDTGEGKVDPLRDGRVTKVLSKVGMEHCYVPWSFGQKGKEKDKLRDPRGIATNSHGQFIIADNGDKTLKVFDSNGNCHHSFKIDQIDDTNTNLEIHDIATDVENNTYVLVENRRAEGYKAEVHVYTKNRLLDKIPVKGEVQGLTVSGSKVLVLGKGDNNVVVVYEYNKRNVAKIKK